MQPQFSRTLVRYTDACLEASQLPWRPARPGERRGIDVFRAPILERWLGRAHWVTPIIWFAPVIAMCLHHGARHMGVARTVVAFFFGWFAWSLLEYLLHRFFFHPQRTPTTPDDRLRAFLVHGYHHIFPDDPYRLVAPPIMSWPLAVGIGGVYRFAVGPHAWAACFAGTVAGYIAYDWIHYYVHHARPTTALGKYFRAHHMQHHFGNGEQRFGISSPVWDFVFRTHR